MLVVRVMRHGDPDLMQAARPGQELDIGLARRSARKLRQRRQRRCLDPFDLVALHLIAAAELGDRRIPHVVVMETAEQVVQHAQAQGPVGIGHALNAEFLENGRHDGHAARKHRQAVALDAGEIERFGRAGLDQHGAQLVQPDAGDTAFAIRIQVVQLQHIGDGACRAGRPHRLLPAHALVIVGDQLDFLGCRNLCLAQAPLVDLAIREEAQRVADAAHVQRFHQLRLVPLADDEFGRAATDIDDQPLVRRHGQRM